MRLSGLRGGRRAAARGAPAERDVTIAALDDRRPFSSPGVARRRVLAALALAAVCSSPVAAQPDRRPPDGGPVAAVQPVEEIAVIGHLDYFPKQREYDAAIRTLKDAGESRASIQAAALPPGLDAASAVAAAKAWRFEPAAENGTAIDRHNNVAVISFRRSTGAYEGSLAFADAYAAVAELIADSRLEEAKSENERMQRTNAETLEELKLSQLQLAAIEHALGNPHAALVAIRRATEQGFEGLSGNELKLALEHRFALEVELGYAADALRTYERRAGIGRLSSRDPLARRAAALERALAAQDASQAVRARLGEDGRWEHPLASKAFEVADTNGAAESVGVECHRKKAELPFTPNAQTLIPQSWGGCVLTVRGEPDTTFTLYEFL